MFDPHRHPANIITNHLVVTALAVWHHEDFVWLLGFYGDPASDMDLKEIEIECTFDELNTLLTELSRGSEMYSDYAERAEEVMEELAEVLTHPGEEEDILNLIAERPDPLYFHEHVFSLALIHEVEDGRYVVPPKPAYMIRGYTRRAPGWPKWEEGCMADTKEEAAAHLARLMVLRYGLFLAFNGRVLRPEALTIAGLTDPQLFALARVQYELLEEAVRSRPEEFE